MTLVFMLLVVTCLILLGAALGKPLGYVVIGLALVALTLQLLGKP